MKFAIVTDTHTFLERSKAGKEILSKKVRVFLKKFIKNMNKTEKPEFVVMLGDLIVEKNKAHDVACIKLIKKEFDKLNCPVYYIAGNHDLKNLSFEEFTELLRIKNPYYSKDFKNVHLVFLHSEEIKENEIVINKTQKKWLEKDLLKTKKECFIFVHHGLADQHLESNRWFKGRASHGLIKNRKEIRALLEKHNKTGKIIGVFNGHLHWNNKNTHNKINYFTIQSIIESQDNTNKASEAHAIVNVNKKVNTNKNKNKKQRLEVKIKGRHPRILS